MKMLHFTFNSSIPRERPFKTLISPIHTLTSNTAGAVKFFAVQTIIAFRNIKSLRHNDAD